MLALWPTLTVLAELGERCVVSFGQRQRGNEKLVAEHFCRLALDPLELQLDCLGLVACILFEGDTEQTECTYG